MHVTFALHLGLALLVLNTKSIQLCVGALNFRDVMLAYGKLSKQQMAHESGGNNIGFEFSGTMVGLIDTFMLLPSYNIIVHF